jgi:hypothetical protein
VAWLLANDGQYEVVTDTTEERIVTFQLASKSVRLTKGHDLDITDPATYKLSARSIEAEAKVLEAFAEPPSNKRELRYMIARLLRDNPQGVKPTYSNKSKRRNMYTDLRIAAHEKF